MPETKELPLSKIIRLPELQTRAVFNAAVAKEYGDEIAEGKTFPALVVFDDGKKLHLAEGFHRADGYEKAGIGEVLCIVHEGTKRDALKHALGSNADHGLRRTAADKRKAVEIALADKEWGQLSVRAIAEMCSVHHSVVNKILKEREAAGEAPRETVKSSDGREMPASTARARSAPVEREPGDELENEPPSGSVSAYFDNKPTRSEASKATHFDDSQHGKLIGPLVRFYQARAERKKCVGCAEHNEAGDLLDKLEANFKAWQKRLPA